MMRAVVAVDRLGMMDPASGAEMMIVRIVRAPWDLPQNASPLKLAADTLPGWETPDAVRARGKLVRSSLQAHPAVAKLLDRIEETPPGQVQPLYVSMAEGEAEQICWETLCDSKDRFVALDPRSPIGRISDPLGGQVRPPAVLRTPIRIMVVISAFKVNGQHREWELFKEAAAKARANGLEIRLKFLVAETALHAAIEGARGAGNDWIGWGASRRPPPASSRTSSTGSPRCSTSSAMAFPTTPTSGWSSPRPATISIRTPPQARSSFVPCISTRSRSCCRSRGC
jgi:hypothetical protein